MRQAQVVSPSHAGTCAFRGAFVSFEEAHAIAIYRQLSQASFNPDAVKRMTTAYECVLQQLDLTNRDDPITELIAAKIIQVFRLGETEPKTLCDRAIRELGVQLR